VLYCPYCASVWQYRGTVPEQVACPVCKKAYQPQEGNVPDKGKFLCTCGTKDQIINSIRKLPEDQLLPMRLYAIEGYCAVCGGDGNDNEDDEDLYGAKSRRKTKQSPDHACVLSKNNGKFFKRITPADLARYQEACKQWEKEKDRLPYPKQEIPEGFNTNQMIKHHYRYWHQMFNPRQLLCLSTLLAAIDEEPDQVLKEMLLSAFYAVLNGNNVFSRFHRFTWREGKVEGIFSRHDYQPKSTFCEMNVWGTRPVYGPFFMCAKKVLDGKVFCSNPYDYFITDDGARPRYLPEKIIWDHNKINKLLATSSNNLEAQKEDFYLVVTDPPYAGNVNYSELSDFFYVWLRLILSKTYSEFAPDLTPKAEEIIENPTRGKTDEDFEQGLTQVFKQCRRVLKDEGLMVFTFHHAEGSAWESLLRAVCNAGFEIDSVYPIHGEAESSLHLMDKQAISYDLIHVCKKRPPDATVTKRSWAGIRQEIRRSAREEIKQIEAGRYGNEPLSPSDVNIILIGKCLELYSRHYGAVVDHEGKEVPLHQALEEIRMMVDQLVTVEAPFPSELSDIDPESYVYLTCFCDRKEIKSDEVHKATRGILEMQDLLESGLIIKGRAKRGRTYEVKQPVERAGELLEKFGAGQSVPEVDLYGQVDNPKVKQSTCFVDKIHFLLALAEGKENLRPWLEQWRGETPQIRAACEYLAGKRKDWAPLTKKILDLMDAGPLFR
jgi:adenine-specific DNA methylase